jgi:putative nucleotidyltransferase with HDIG domain
LDDNPAVAQAFRTIRAITARQPSKEELRQSVEALQRTLEGMINLVAAMIEKRDTYAAGHHQRVAQLACAIAKEMGLNKERIEGIRVTGILHDVGKIDVPMEILNKPSQLSNIEFAVVRSHVQVGYELLREVEFPWPVASILLQHHERMDGSGYPNGLVGKNILLEARILGIADVVEAMTSRRPHRPALGISNALGELVRNTGILYDADAVEACVKLFTEKGFAFEGGFGYTGD